MRIIMKNKIAYEGELSSRVDFYSNVDANQFLAKFPGWTLILGWTLINFGNKFQGGRLFQRGRLY